MKMQVYVKKNVKVWIKEFFNHNTLMKWISWKKWAFFGFIIDIYYVWLFRETLSTKDVKNIYLHIFAESVLEEFAGGLCKLFIEV